MWDEARVKAGAPKTPAGEPRVNHQRGFHSFGWRSDILINWSYFPRWWSNRSSRLAVPAVGTSLVKAAKTLPGGDVVHVFLLYPVLTAAYADVTPVSDKTRFVAVAA